MHSSNGWSWMPDLMLRPAGQGRDREFERKRTARLCGANRLMEVVWPQYPVQPPFSPAPVAGAQRLLGASQCEYACWRRPAATAALLTSNQLPCTLVK